MARSRPDLAPRSVRAAALAGALAFACVAAAQPGPAPQDAAEATAPKPAKSAKSAATATGLPPGNSEMPINLEAASSDFDYRNNALEFRRVKITQGGLVVTAERASATGLEFQDSEWRLQGDVQITVPGGSLRASEARVQFRDNAIARASIKGGPAQFEQRLRENDQIARGRAQAIDYVVKDSTVRLTGDAWLTDGRNEIRGNTLVYDVARERVQANPNEKDPGGVRITINPPQKNQAQAPGSGP